MLCFGHLLNELFFNEPKEMNIPIVYFPNSKFSLYENITFYKRCQSVKIELTLQVLNKYWKEIANVDETDTSHQTNREQLVLGKIMKSILAGLKQITQSW